MWDRFPPRMRKAITTALEKAGHARLDEASTEHLLAAVASDPTCAGFFMLDECGVAPAKVLAQLNGAIGPGSASRAEPAASNTLQMMTPYAVTPWTERATRMSSAAMHVLDVAVAEADRRGDRQVGTEHLALALARLGQTNPAAKLLADLGFTHDRGEAALKTWRRRGVPGQRGGAGSALSSPTMRWLSQPIRAIAHYPTLAWHVLVGKSLGHPAFVTNPYPLYRKLRERSPVRRDPLAPVWVVTRYADTMTMVRDPRFKKDPFAAERLPPVAREQLAVSDASAGRASAEMVSMLFLDPPEHTRVRGIFTKAFTPRRLESLRSRIAQVAEKRLDRAEQRGDRSIELIGDLAYPLPVTVIAELLGFPPEDYEQIKKWSDAMAEALTLSPTADAQARAFRARMEIRQYFEGIVARLKQSPGENLISALITGEGGDVKGSDRGERLGPDELFSNSILLLVAGHETTTNLIGNGVLALLQNPDQLRDLRANPDLIASAVEEMLRYDAPVQWMSRVTGETLELGGVEIERGQVILGSIGAANRDPAIFADPDRFDIRRKENRHLSFGAGAHFCLGAALARMEAQIAVTALIQRYPKLRLAGGKLKWRKGLSFRGVHELRLLT
jgi:pimeloyl-[acyl-carrier protein] synthase